MQQMEKTENSRSLWRKKGGYYFNVPNKISRDAESDNREEEQAEKLAKSGNELDDKTHINYLTEYPRINIPIDKRTYYRYAHLKEIKESVKIAINMNYPLSFYIDKSGNCSLYSITSNCTPTLLGTSVLTDSSSKPITNPTSVAHFENWILVSNKDGVYQYGVNSAEIVRGQNIDDFVQMALPVQKQPQNLEKVACFISSDVQIPTWTNGVHSVIEEKNLKEEDKSLIFKQVQKALAASRFSFKAESQLTAFFNHQTPTTPPLMPMAGPIDTGVRQIAFTYRKPTVFQSISGAQWFNWDLKAQKLIHSGVGDGFQLLSIDASPILKQTFAVSTHCGNVLIYDMRAQDSVQTIKYQNPRPISYVKFSPIIQPLIATSSDTFDVNLWDLRSSFDKPYLKLSGHTHEITGIQFSYHRADLVYSSSFDSTIKLWNINDQLPNNLLLSISPEPNVPVLDIQAGCHRTDSIYYSCANGTTGMAKMNEQLFREVVPHKLTDPDDRLAESYLYMRENQNLLTKILPKVTQIIKERSNVAPIFPLLDLTGGHSCELTTTELSKEPLKKVIDFYSYYISNAIPQQLMQAPETNQLADAKRFKLFGKVIGSILNNDAETLMFEKRNILSTLDAFTREDVLAIVQVLASSAFDEALEVGANYVELLLHGERNKQEKGLDIEYFLLYPTIYDDPTKPFEVLNKVEHNLRSTLRTLLNNGPKILSEIRDYIAILACASNNTEQSASRIYDVLSKHERFLSMFLLRTYLNASLSDWKFSSCIIMASQAAKDTVGYPLHDSLFTYLNDTVRGMVSDKINEALDNQIFPLPVISQVLAITMQAQELPPEFEELIKQLGEKILKKIEKFFSSVSPTEIDKIKKMKEFAGRIQQDIDKNNRSAVQGRAQIITNIHKIVANFRQTYP